MYSVIPPYIMARTINADVKRQEPPSLERFFDPIFDFLISARRQGLT
jgi:hypothetical protein